MNRFLISIFNRVWVVYAIMFLIVMLFFNRNQVADDVLNIARPSADYLHFFSYGTKPFDKNEFKRAKAYYQTLISGKFSTSAMHADLGFCDYYLKDTKSAVKQYNIAVQKDQRMYAFYYDLGVIAQSQKDHQRAQEMFKKSIFLLPRTKDDLLNALHIPSKYRGQMMFEYYFHQRLPWDTLMAYVHLLESLSTLKMYSEVLGYAAEAIKLFPNDPEIFFYASLGAYHSGFFKESLGFIVKAITIAPNYAKAYELKAMLMHELGNEEALKQDRINSQHYKGYEDWHRNSEIQELHHWDENTLLFQIYR